MVILNFFIGFDNLFSFSQNHELSHVQEDSNIVK
jgi:hypothetical protein